MGARTEPLFMSNTVSDTAKPMYAMNIGRYRAEYIKNPYEKPVPLPGPVRQRNRDNGLQIGGTTPFDSRITI